MIDFVSQNRKIGTIIREKDTMDATIDNQMKTMKWGFEMASAKRAINSETKEFEQLNGPEYVVRGTRFVCMMHPPPGL